MTVATFNLERTTSKRRAAARRSSLFRCSLSRHRKHGTAGVSRTRVTLCRSLFLPENILCAGDHASSPGRRRLFFSTIDELV